MTERGNGLERPQASLGKRAARKLIDLVITAVVAVVLITAGLVGIVWWMTAEPSPETVERAQQAAAQAQAEEVACRSNLQCWGDRHIISAGVRCESPVESLGQYAAEWTDGFIEPKFSRFRWLDQEAGTLTFIGDKIQFQNGFGAWQPHVYECDYDPGRETVLAVRAAPGRP